MSHHEDFSTTSEVTELACHPHAERDHRQGPFTALVTLVEYGDYECPYTGQAYPIVKEIQKRLGDDLQFVFRNFPLTVIHPHAFNAALAAETASAQGKFWEMYDYLFHHQQSLDDNDLKKYAENIGLDMLCCMIRNTVKTILNS